MRRQKRKSTYSRWSIAVLFAVLLIIIFAIVPNYVPYPVSPTALPQVFATLNPTVEIHLTNIPEAPPLTGAEAEQLHQLQVQVNACEDYSEQRRSQVSQHIRWLLNPSTIPADMVIALGENVTGRLVFGMAVYTSSEWRLRNRPEDSCLITVGRVLNEMLVAAGEPALTIYDE